MASVYTSGKSEHSAESPPGMPACNGIISEGPSGLGQSSVSQTGVLVGSLSASGTSCLNRCIERASAISLDNPGICVRDMLKLFFAARRKSFLYRFARLWFFGAFDCQALTTA